MYTDVPMISQSTLALCWEACGRMLWGWKFQKQSNCWDRYKLAAGGFLAMNQGLKTADMSVFYSKLGIRALSSPRGANIIHALKWSLVIVPSVSGKFGHALVVIDGNSTNYTLINPAAVSSISFDDDENVSEGTAVAGRSIVARSNIDSSLGDRIWYW